MDLIFENEGTTAGTHAVIEKIFKEQFGLQPKQLHRRLRLAYGDQKTFSNAHSVKRDLADEQDAVDQKDWLFVVPGLFHFCMAFLEQIHSEFSAPENDEHQSTGLVSHATVLGRQTVSRTASHFSHVERLVEDSGDARIVAFLLGRLEPAVGRVNIRQRERIEQEIKSWDPAEFNRYVGVAYASVATIFIMIAADA